MAYNPTEVKEMLTNELLRARKKHSHWPVDTVHRAAILADQAGGILREALPALEGKADNRQLEAEVLHTAVVCIRWLEGG